MNLKTFISPQYLFQVNSAFISPGEKLFLFGGAVLVLLAIVLKISSILAPTPVDAKYRQKFYNLFLYVGFGELLWYLCRYENVLFFSTRFVALLIALIGLIWLAAIIVSLIKNYSSNKESWQKEQVKLKYLPK